MADIAEGIVTKVNRSMTGESEHGEWTMYKFVVTDSRGDHQCSTFSDSIGARIKKGVTVKFSYEDNEFTTKDGTTVKEWRVEELFGDVSAPTESSSSQPNQQPAQRTLATNDPDFPYQYGRARSGAYQIVAAEIASGRRDTFDDDDNLSILVDRITETLYKAELAQVERMQQSGSPADTTSASVEPSSAPQGAPPPDNSQLVQFDSGANEWKWIGDSYGFALEIWRDFGRICDYFDFSNQEIAESLGLPPQATGGDVVKAAGELFADKTGASLVQATFLHVWGKHQENTPPEELPW